MLGANEHDFSFHHHNVMQPNDTVTVDELLPAGYNDFPLIRQMSLTVTVSLDCVTL